MTAQTKTTAKITKSATTTSKARSKKPDAVGTTPKPTKKPSVTEVPKDGVAINGKKYFGPEKLKYKENPKRKGSKARERYEAYQKAKTFAEYWKIADPKTRKADFAYDSMKGFIEIS